MRIKSMTTLFFVACLAVFMLFPISGFTEDDCTSMAQLTVKTDTQEYAADMSVSIPITVDNPSTIAGAAFTIQYDKSLEVEVVSAFFDTFYQQLSDPALTNVGDPICNDGTCTFPVNGGESITIPPVVGSKEYDQPLVTSGDTDISGRIVSQHIAAARVMPAESGGETTIFTLNVKLKDGEPTVTYPISIIPTELSNVEAGYTTPTKIDLLVGSDLEQSIDSGNAFPVVLSVGCSGSGSNNITDGQVKFAADYDGDNLPDSWETKNFPVLSTTDGSGDYDHDGLTDAQEYAISSDPTDNTSPADFTSLTPIGSNTSVTFTGNFTIDGSNASLGDGVLVFDPQGVFCGATSVTTAGEYQVTVYGDNPSTDADEGAVTGETLTFVAYDDSEAKYIQVGDSMFSEPDANIEITHSAIPPQWSTDNDPLGLDLNVTSECTFQFELKAGWNLFSFPLNVVYYTGDNPPDVALFNNIDAKVMSIEDALSSISGKYDVITSYDGQAHTYYPGLPPEYQYLNDMEYMAGGYGYWIKMNEAATIVLTGSCLDPSEAITLSSGWHLVGSWSASAQYEGTEPDNVTIPDNYAWEAISIDDTIVSISGQFDVITSYDGQAHTYYPGLPPEYQYLNDMKYMAPGYGYWIKVNSEASLHY